MKAFVLSSLCSSLNSFYSFVSFLPLLQFVSEVVSSEVDWYVAHTRPRCEKKLEAYCQREGFSATLPTYKSVRKYRGKTAIFSKPLFPGYVFLQVTRAQRQKVYQSDYVANLLEVVDQDTFREQLGDILFALEAETEIRLAPTIIEGTTVRIRNGALQGLTGTVEKRTGTTEVHLRLDFIGQAAAVRVSAEDLEEA